MQIRSELAGRHCHGLNAVASEITPLVSESHLFRQDIDHYLVKAAIKYGADYRDKTDVQDIAFNDDGVVLRTTAGEEFHARYLVDGTGHKSMVAQKFGLREGNLYRVVATR